MSNRFEHLRISKEEFNNLYVFLQIIQAHLRQSLLRLESKVSKDPKDLELSNYSGPIIDITHVYFSKLGDEQANEVYKVLTKAFIHFSSNLHL